MQNKFNQVDYTLSVEAWGEAFITGTIDFNTNELRYKEQIKGMDMPLHQAQNRLDALIGDKPYYSAEEYMGDLAALCTVHRDEVSVKTTQKSAPLSLVLWRATSSNRLGFYFNNIRKNMIVPRRHFPQLSSGTCAVESLNHEINIWFRHTKHMYQSTLFLGHDMFVFYKLLTHHSAEYSPTEVQMTAWNVATQLAAHWKFTNEEWEAIGTQERCLLALRNTQCAKIKAHKREHAQVVQQKFIKKTKRHTFNKLRV